jgi:hypothetical protein
MSKDSYTVKAHLQAHHDALGKFHKSMAEHHTKISEHHGHLAKLQSGDVADHHNQISKAHAAAAQTHADFADFNDDAMELCNSMTKAIGMNPDAIVPDRVSSIIPIPRAGQREFDKSFVPVELDDIIPAI